MGQDGQLVSHQLTNQLTRLTRLLHFVPPHFCLSFNFLHNSALKRTNLFSHNLSEWILAS